MYQKANAQGESGTDPRFGVFNQKENKRVESEIVRVNF
jgi:hypothetical protein